MLVGENDGRAAKPRVERLNNFAECGGPLSPYCNRENANREIIPRFNVVVGRRMWGTARGESDPAP
jgi:hypothetical protein